MESKRLFVEGVKTESGKVLVTAGEVARELARTEGIEQPPKKNNVIHLSKLPQNNFGWEDYGYVDDPNNMEESYDEFDYSDDNYEYYDECSIEPLIELIEAVGIQNFFKKCIEDGTRIIERVKKGGKRK